MTIYIENTTTGDIEDIRIINDNHESKIVQVISNILGVEPNIEEDCGLLTIFLTSREIDKLYIHISESPDDLARIIDVKPLDALRGIKGIDY